ncbi:hypothetical protein ACSBPH_08405 [Microbacterium sp. F51-2R]|uniref:hypothetical protein n=1 Tax=Microbacterium sp. F51-2R TaxID=3445777 RepID=UPI003F9F0EA7
MDERVIVLLGAGASVDAGLHLTTALAEVIVRNVNASALEERGPRGELPDWVRALNFAYGAMVGYQAEDGSDPLQAVNIERLISALRLLQDSRTHEVAPFVGAWKPGALGVGAPHVDSHLGDRVIRAIGNGFGEGYRDQQAVSDAIAAIARSAVHTASPGEFKEAEERILSELSQVLSNVKNVGYLYPLAELAKSQGRWPRYPHPQLRLDY